MSPGIRLGLVSRLRIALLVVAGAALGVSTGAGARGVAPTDVREGAEPGADDERADARTASERPIRVGVRNNSEPFSFRVPGVLDERAILGEHGGYMVAICRRVLARMVATGPFSGRPIETVEVSASERFPLLEAGGIDLLCGPDSITLGRLADFNVSHPLFLSGISYVSVAQDKVPKGVYCKAVIGLLEGTTAEHQGLAFIARTNELGRFDKALDAYLAAASSGTPKAPTELGRALDAIRADLAHALSGNASPLADDVPSPGRPAPESVVTSECEEGYETGPVEYFDDHDAGLKAFCERKILYYIGDFDIINRKLRDDDNCSHVTRRETLTRESYGVYFRKPDDDSVDSMRDATLYAEFNNVLLRKMEAENILAYEFEKAFPHVEMSADLRTFFDSFRYATDY